MKTYSDMKVIINGNIYLTDKNIGQVLTDDEYRTLRMMRAHNVTTIDKRSKKYKKMIESLHINDEMPFTHVLYYDDDGKVHRFKKYDNESMEYVVDKLKKHLNKDVDLSKLIITR